MSEETTPNTEAKSIPGLPNPPAPAPSTKAEHEAAQAAAKAAREPVKEGLEETHGKTEPKKADPAPVTDPTPPSAKTQKDIDDAVEAARAKAKEEWSGEYTELEHEAGQAVINMLKAAEVPPAEANAFFAKAIESGKLEDVDWVGLEKKIGKDQMVLAKAGIHAYYNDVYVERNKDAEAVYKEYGSKENWETVRTWAQNKEEGDKAFAAQVNDFRKALNTGGFAAIAAARELKNLYEADPNTKGFDNAKLVHGDKIPEPVGGPLGRDEYLKLRKEADRNGAKPDEINSLIARRTLGRQRGM